MNNTKALLAKYKSDTGKIVEEYLDKYIQTTGGFDYFFEKESKNFRKKVADAGTNFLLKNNKSPDNIKELTTGVQLIGMDVMLDFVNRLKAMS